MKLPQPSFDPQPPEDLAPLWRIPLSTEKNGRAEWALRERIKELNCLYGISQLAERHAHSLDALLRDLVRYLPYAWQFPEITRARIVFRGDTYATEGFRESEWLQSSQIRLSQEVVGEVTVVYLEERPFFSDEGPFLKEERALLDTLAEHVGRIAARISAESGLEEMNRRLKLESQALQESNAALRVLLARIEQERQDTRKDIQTNVERIVIPVVQALEVQVSPPQRAYLQMLRKNLDDLTSPFIGRLTGSFPSLTPTEVSICNMIRNGLRTKEIADTRGVSAATINRQRERIRDKLGITNKDVNLATFLQSRMPDQRD